MWPFQCVDLAGFASRGFGHVDCVAAVRHLMPGRIGISGGRVNISIPGRCDAVITSLPSSPAPSNITLVAVGLTGTMRIFLAFLNQLARRAIGGPPGEVRGIVAGGFTIERSAWLRVPLPSCY